MKNDRKVLPWNGAGRTVVAFVKTSLYANKRYFKSTEKMTLYDKTLYELSTFISLAVYAPNSVNCVPGTGAEVSLVLQGFFRKKRVYKTRQYKQRNLETTTFNQSPGVQNNHCTCNNVSPCMLLTDGVEKHLAVRCLFSSCLADKLIVYNFLLERWFYTVLIWLFSAMTQRWKWQKLTREEKPVILIIEDMTFARIYKKFDERRCPRWQ